jgi:hypothetical protein
MDKHVWVCNIANWGDEGLENDALLENNMRYNQMLSEYLSRYYSNISLYN